MAEAQSECFEVGSVVRGSHLSRSEHPARHCSVESQTTRVESHTHPYELQRAVMTTTPVALKTRNLLGLISIILAIGGFALAVVPFLGLLGWPLLIAAFVLGIIGLTRRGQAKGTSITGLAVSVVAMVSAPVIALGLFAGSIHEANSTKVNTAPSASSGGAKPAEESSKPGSRQHPVPLGSEVKSKDWTVVVESVNFEIASDPTFIEANQHFDTTLPEGEQFVAIAVRYIYTGDDPEGAMPAMVSTDLVTASGTTVPYDVIAVYGDRSISTNKLYNGGTAMDTIIRTAPTAEVGGLVIAVKPGVLADTVFVATK